MGEGRDQRKWADFRDVKNIKLWLVIVNGVTCTVGHY